MPRTERQQSITLSVGAREERESDGSSTFGSLRLTANRSSKQLFPTPLSPINTSLKR